MHLQSGQNFGLSVVEKKLCFLLCSVQTKSGPKKNGFSEVEKTNPFGSRCSSKRTPGNPQSGKGAIYADESVVSILPIDPSKWAAPFRKMTQQAKVPRHAARPKVGDGLIRMYQA